MTTKPYRNTSDKPQTTRKVAGETLTQVSPGVWQLGPYTISNYEGSYWTVERIEAGAYVPLGWCLPDISAYESGSLAKAVKAIKFNDGYNES